MQDERIAKELHLHPNDSFYYIKRLRLVDDKPMIIQHSYIIPEFIKEEEIADKDAFVSVYGKIREDYGLDLHHADSKEITEIVYPTPVEARELLQLEDGAPSAFTRRYTYLFDGRTIEYIEGYKRWDYFSIEIEPI